MMTESNLPLSEQFRLTAKQWIEADKAAALLEETKSANISQMMIKVLEENPALAVNKIEMVVKSSPEYKDFITKMVDLRSQSNLLKVKLEYIRMKFSEKQSQEATARAESRL